MSLARFADRHGRLVPFIPGTDGLLWHERRRMAREYARKMRRPISPGARAEMARQLAQGAPVRRMRQYTYTLPASERQRLLRILRGHAAAGDKAAALAVHRLEEMQPEVPQKKSPQRWVRRVVIEIPEEAGPEAVERIETAATHAAFDAEPKDRDGWDINVYSSREEAP